ncbi:MAG: hypothetical protein CL677_09060 [Bdellovibrionaceae bacterium]|nr:hypothetical protein [Pseudobdellovibrionaceae bacterium]|tara:strand:+ start:72582 stop:73400 length:819 start_codon:yes stop_codon:yes gene_type:complete
MSVGFLSSLIFAVLFGISALAKDSYSRWEIPKAWDDDSVKTICDGSDSRELSEDKFAARVLNKRNSNGGCSATLLANNCMVTAGHCVGILKVIQFNVPESRDSKAIPSALEDEYQVDRSSIVYGQTGEGNDWAVFNVMENAITGLLPEEAQGGFIQVDYEVPEVGQVLQISGYGSSERPKSNFAQQTSFGPLVSMEASGRYALNYRADTTGGNSGSGVRNAETQALIGVHSHGGCYSSDSTYNKGTSIALNSRFRQAVEDCLEVSFVRVANP